MSVLFYLFFNFFVVIAAKNQVPVFLWSQHSELSSSPGLKHLGPVAFSELLLDHLGTTKPMIAVFLEEKLSNEDFTLTHPEGRPVFGALKETVSGAKTLFLPSVGNPIKAVRDLDVDGYKRVQLTGTVPTGLKNPTIFVIPLSDDSEKTRDENLSQHLKELNRLYGDLAKAYPDILAIYTGKTSSFEIGESHSRVRREDPVEEPYLLMQAKDFVILATGIEYKTKPDAEPIVIDQVTSTELLADEASNTKTLKVAFPDLTISFAFVAGDDERQWTVTHVLHDTDKILLPSTPIWAPRRWSWFCHQEVLFATPRTSDKSDTFVLNITGLQIQPFMNDTSGEFGQAMDCMPYFSIAIWTGIFIVLLMLFILGWGLTMLMDINTNDRFDDPKGKTITISATD